MYTEKTITILSESSNEITWWSATRGFYQYFYQDLFKFNIANNQNIGFYNDSVIQGESLKNFNTLIKDGLIDLIENYHKEITTQSATLIQFTVGKNVEKGGTIGSTRRI